MGKTVENTPFVWTVLREIQESVKKEVNDINCQWSAMYGDYMFYLYRKENIVGNKTIPVRKNELPLPAQDQPYTNTAESYLEKADINSPSASARRNAPGNNYMSFDVDNGWQYAGLRAKPDLKYKISIIYLDHGSDTFSVEYKDEAGLLKKLDVAKTATDKWIKKDWEITDIYLDDQMEGMTDFRINNNADGDEIVHMVQLWGSGEGATFPEVGVTGRPPQGQQSVGGGATATPRPTATPTPTLKPIQWMGVGNAPQANTPTP
jgi:hypothetical protein